MQKWPENDQFCIFRSFFRMLGAQSGGGGFCKFLRVFFVCPALGRFCALHEPDRIASQKWVLGGTLKVAQKSSKIHDFFQGSAQNHFWPTIELS